MPRLWNALTVPEEIQSRKNKITFSSGLLGWLLEHRTAFAFSTYDSGSVFFCGVRENRIHLSPIKIPRAMGLCATENGLWIAGNGVIWRYENHLSKGETSNGFDRIYMPRASHHVGDVDLHEVSRDENGFPIFVSTKYSCVARLSESKSFSPIWHPDFITKLVPEDRCHLNGLFVENGKLRLVSYVGKSDTLHGWRAHRASGGYVYDIGTGELTGTLSMPHSPRIKDGYTYFLDSGRGFLTVGVIQIFCPGFLRGLSFHNGFALVTISLPRDGIFKGLELQENIKNRGGYAKCAVLIIDLKKECIAQWLEIEGDIKELFDCVFLPGVSCAGSFSPNDPAVFNRVEIER